MDRMIFIFLVHLTLTVPHCYLPFNAMGWGGGGTDQCNSMLRRCTVQNIIGFTRILGGGGFQFIEIKRYVTLGRPPTSIALNPIYVIGVYLPPVMTVCHCPTVASR